LESIPEAAEHQELRLSEMCTSAPDERFQRHIYTTWLPTMHPSRQSDGVMGRCGGHRLLKKIDEDSNKVFQSSQELGNLTWRHEATHMAEFFAQMAKAGENGFIPYESFKTAMTDFAHKRQIGNIDSALQAVQKKKAKHVYGGLKSSCRPTHPMN